MVRGTGTLHRYSLAARLVWAAVFALGGLIGGAFFLPIPILHLCLTWALPLAGLIAAYRTLVTELALQELEGPCPLCQAPAKLEGGSGPGPHFGSCAGCLKPLEARLAA